MEVVTIVFLSIAAILFLVLVSFSFTFLGLWLSELGLWLSWIPFALIIASIPIMVLFYFDSKAELDFFFMLVSGIINLVTFSRLIFPFLRINATNRRFRKNMKKYLGKDYLLFVEPLISSRFFKNVKFKLSHYFSGLKEEALDKRVKTEEGLVYRIIEDTKLQLDVYYPNREGVFPIILFVHGGGWMKGSRAQHRNVKVGKMLANYGYTVFNIDYRLAPAPRLLSMLNYSAHDNPTIREMVSDVRSGILYAKQNASKYKGDPDNLLLFGRSAGAHLALLTAFSCEEEFFEKEGISCSVEDSKVAGVVAFYPMTDLEELYESYEAYSPLKLSVQRGTGGKPHDAKEVYQLFSPIKYVTEENVEMIPPVFLVTGLKDKVVAAEQSEELFENLQKIGVKSVLLELPWANHGFDLVLMGPGGQLVYKYLTQFLVWAAATSKLEKFEEMAEELELEAIVSKEKIKTVHKLNKRQKRQLFRRWRKNRKFLFEEYPKYKKTK